MTLSPIELITGPQLPIGSTYFNTTQVAMARKLGEMCPVTPPTDPLALNSYNVNLMYYDLPLSEYIVYARTGDPYFFDLFIKCADSWWKHPEWIGEGKIQKFPDEATPPPRHVGIMGLMLRAIHGRPEMWPFIVAYVTNNLKMWLLWRINNPALWVDVREGALAFQYAVLLSQCLPDEYPNGAQIRAQLLADCERIVIQYYQRLQYPCGCWRYDAFVDGIQLVKVTQPFTLGLLLHAFADLHQVTQNAVVKEALKTMILKTSRHLYADGPYRKNDPIPYDPSKRWRSFWYLYHGGTSTDPTEFEHGGWSYPGNNIGEVQDGRQAIGPIIGIYGYAYNISGDPFYLEALTDLWDAAYGETDGIKTYFNTDGKGFNQHCRRAGSGPAWAGWEQTFPPSLPAPTPAPSPEPVPPPPAPAPPSSDTVIVITSPLNGETVSGRVTVTFTVTNSADIAEIYLVVNGSPRLLGSAGTRSFAFDTAPLPDGSHSLFIRAWKGSVAIDSKTISVTVKNAVEPAPTPTPVPVPQPCKLSAPESITLPSGGSGVITVTLENMTSPTEVRAVPSSGQIMVNPGLKQVSGTSASIQFQVVVKKRGGSITFSSGCGSKVVNVNVQ